MFRVASERDGVLLAEVPPPLRERNDLLLAAGYAALYRESDFEAEEMAPARRALDLILDHHEPFPAVVMDRYWNLLRGNGGAVRLFSTFVDLESVAQPANVLRLMFDPEGVRPFVANWEAVAQTLIQRAHREAVGGVPDDATRLLIEEILSYPGVPRRWRVPDLAAPVVPFVPVRFSTEEGPLAFFSAVTTLGTPQDITLQEIRLESFFPADEATAERMRTP